MMYKSRSVLVASGSAILLVGAAVVAVGHSHVVDAVSHHATKPVGLHTPNPKNMTLANAALRVNFPVKAPTALPSQAIKDGVTLTTAPVNMVELRYTVPGGGLDVWEGPANMKVSSPNSKNTTIDGFRAQVSQWNRGQKNLCSVVIWNGQAMYEVIGVNVHEAEVQAVVSSIVKP